MSSKPSLQTAVDPSTQPPNYPTSAHSTHTFSHSPSGPQICAYIIILSSILTFYLCPNTVSPTPSLVYLYSISCMLVLILGLICSCSNPTDPMVYHYKWSKYNGNIKFQSQIGETCYCQYCTSYCANKSKHCRVCNRCTKNFDHHCIWINNCIGHANYRVFFGLILCVFINFTIFLIAGAIASFTPTQGYLQYLVPMWIMMAILSILDFLLLQLILFHIYLQCRGISTYEFLQERRRQEELELQEKFQKRQKQDQRQREEKREKEREKDKEREEQGARERQLRKQSMEIWRNQNYKQKQKEEKQKKQKQDILQEQQSRSSPKKQAYKEKGQGTNQSQQSLQSINLRNTITQLITVRPRIIEKQSSQIPRQKERERSGSADMWGQQQQIKIVDDGNRRIGNLQVCEERIQEDNNNDQLPDFFKRNRSLKIIFGSPDVQISRHSHKKLPALR